jgi:beta-galactosidase
VKEFQRWLERRYGTLDALNAAWWTSFWSHRYGAWSEINPRRTCLDGMAVDWKRFTTWQCCQFMRNETAPLRELAPETPVTTNMMGTNDFFIDNWPLAEVCDFISDDAYCFWDDADEYIVEAARKAFMHDMHRSMKGGRPFLVMEHGVSSLNWTPYYRLKRPGVHKLEILNAIGHGADGTLFFQWRKSRGSMEKFHAAPVDHVGHENTRVFKEIRETSELQRRIAAVPAPGRPSARP